MEYTERLVKTWVASQRDEEILQMVSDISSEKTALINVVKALGEYLTSEDGDLRSKGVELLSLILERLPQEQLNRQAVRVLTPFYCGKLEDIDTIIPALRGLQTVASLPSFGSTEATVVAEALILHVRMKALTQVNRFKVYSIVDSLVANHRNSLKALGIKFLDGYIALAEGEKDPRNLLVAFAIARVILIEFDISERVQSMFDITFCYFPISFRPPPNDPYGISSDDMRNGLCRCLNATSLFGPLALPLFLEKLVSGNRQTKKDTLQAIIQCLPVYGPTLTSSYARKLWNSLKLEVFQSIDGPIEEEALRAVQVLVATIYSGEETMQESVKDIQGLARDACEECIQILREPEKSQAKPATRILCSFMNSTPSVAQFTVSQTVPHLTKLFFNPDETPAHAATLILLSQFIEAARDSMPKSQTGEIALLPYKDEVLGIYMVGLRKKHLCLPALGGLKAMITTKGLLSDQEFGFVVHNLNEIMQSNPDEFEDISEEILELLLTISQVSPHHVIEQTLPLLFSSLPDYAPPRGNVKGRAQCWKTLTALQTLCTQPELFETLVIRLTTKLDLVCFPRAMPEDIEPCAAYAHAILKVLSNTLFAKVEKRHTDVPKYIDRLVPHIFNLFVFSALESGERQMIATDHRLLQVGAQIITLVVQSLPIHRQETFLHLIIKLLLDGNVNNIRGDRQGISSHSLLIFGDATPTIQKDLLALFSAGIISMHKEVKLDIPDLSHFLENIIHWTLYDAENDLQRTSAIQIVSSIVNRKSEELSGFLNGFLNEYWDREIANTDRPFVNRSWAIKSWIWVAKALLIRNNPLFIQLSERLFDVFNDTSINWDAAKAVGAIPSPDKSFTKQNHAVLRILYAQKYVNRLLPRIIAGAKDATKPVEQISFLVSLTSLIKSTPKASYADDLPSLIPLLIRGLELPDPDIRSDIIDTFIVAAEGETPEKNLIAEHGSTLVVAMLKNSMAAEIPSARVRISALRYLGKLPGIVRYDVLHPYKQLVLRELGKALDDPKRSVRKEAVDARTNWFKYSG